MSWARCRGRCPRTASTGRPRSHPSLSRTAARGCRSRRDRPAGPVNAAAEALLLHGHDPARPEEPHWFNTRGAVEAGEMACRGAGEDLLGEQAADGRVDGDAPLAVAPRCTPGRSGCTTPAVGITAQIATSTSSWSSSRPARCSISSTWRTPCRTLLGPKADVVSFGALLAQDAARRDAIQL